VVSRYRNISAGGSGVEVVIWRVPDPGSPGGHRASCRLVYVLNGKRLLALENENGNCKRRFTGAPDIPQILMDDDIALIFSSGAGPMPARTLTITLNPDHCGALETAMKTGMIASAYCGETMNFETPGIFFSRLTKKRWDLLHALQGAGELAVRELARRLARDVRRVHGDAAVLVELGLVELSASGGLRCPFDEIHVNLHLRPIDQHHAGDA
jgi:predicted transcriptional regulator